MWEIRHISKNFGKVNALSDFSVSLDEGKIYGLVGANGSGKSTLINILTGTVAPDEGDIYKNNKKLSIKSPKDAHEFGIYASYQDMSLSPNLTVMENILLGVELKQYGILMDHNEMIERASEVFELLDKEIPLEEKVKNLKDNEMQIVEIAKLIFREPELALFDEPTSFLSEDQIDSIFEVIHDLADQDTTVIFVSHRLKEIMEICDEVVVAREGNQIGKFNVNEVDEGYLSAKMAGVDESKGEVEERFVSEEDFLKESEVDSFFSVSDFTTPDRLSGLNFNVDEHEILGIAGLKGQGQAELLKALYGLVPHEGAIKHKGRNLEIGGPRDAIENGMIYISGDRDSEGILHSRSVKENIALIKNAYKMLVEPADEDMEKEISSRMIDELDIECGSMEDRASSLSGGNQQKLFIARGLAENPRVLLLNDPFRGVDIMTRRSVLRKLSNLAEERAIIFYSSDIKEIASVASRVLVMYEGEIIAEFKGGEIDKDMITEVSIKGKK